MLNLDVCRPEILLRRSANLYQLQLQVLKLLCLYNFACCVFRLSFKENVFLSSTEFALIILDSLIIFCFLKMTAIACNGFEFNLSWIKWCYTSSGIVHRVMLLIYFSSTSNTVVYRMLMYIEYLDLLL